MGFSVKSTIQRTWGSFITQEITIWLGETTSYTSDDFGYHPGARVLTHGILVKIWCFGPDSQQVWKMITVACGLLWDFDPMSSRCAGQAQEEMERIHHWFGCFDLPKKNRQLENHPELLTHTENLSIWYFFVMTFETWAFGWDFIEVVNPEKQIPNMFDTIVYTHVYIYIYIIYIYIYICIKVSAELCSRFAHRKP